MGSLIPTWGLRNVLEEVKSVARFMFWMVMVKETIRTVWILSEYAFYCGYEGVWKERLRVR